jgi:Mg/Co/Ni transporter MgtE
MHPLSIVHSDEEEGRFPDAPTSPAIDAGGDDDDDDSHRKHLPRILQIPNSPGDCGQTINSHTAGFQPFWENLKERSRWLIGLLFFQSCSSFIIQYNEEFLQDHMVIVQFLTMLVGAGGNAGNQASVGVIRSLAIGTLNRHTTKFYLWREAKMAVSLSALIGLTGFVRVAIFRTPPGETIAITASVFAIVAISVGIGTTLPLAMKKVGIDPCHSSTSIQVIMDILGVLITVCVSTLVLNLKAFQSAG